MGNLEFEIKREGKGVGVGDLEGEDDLKYDDEVGATSSTISKPLTQGNGA